MSNKHSVHELEAEWKDYSSHYPKSLLEIGRAKVLIGPDGVVINTEISMAVMEIDPGCVYPLHNHDAPEAYYVLEGEAICTWGEDEFRAVAGTAIQTIPGMPHRIESVGDKKFRAVAIWWAPGGNSEVLNCKLNLIEDIKTEEK